MNGQSIIEAARRYEGARFRHQGRDPRTGVDCVGLAVVIARDLGIDCVDSVTYARCPNPRNLLRVLSKSCDRISRAGGDALALDGDSSAFGVARAGDLLIFSPRRPNLPRHLAVFTGSDMVHAVEGNGIDRVVEVPISQNWRECLHSTWRFRWQR